MRGYRIPIGAIVDWMNEKLVRTGRCCHELIVRIRKIAGDVAIFSHGHILRVFAARWIGLPPEAGCHFLLNTGTVCVLGHYRDEPAIRIWNGPLVAPKS